MENMLEASNVNAQCVVEESSKGLSTGEKMNIEVIQRYFVNNIVVLISLLKLLLNKGII